MIDGIPNRPLYFSRKDIIGYLWKLKHDLKHGTSSPAEYWYHTWENTWQGLYHGRYQLPSTGWNQDPAERPAAGPAADWWRNLEGGSLDWLEGNIYKYQNSTICWVLHVYDTYIYIYMYHKHVKPMGLLVYPEFSVKPIPCEKTESLVPSGRNKWHGWLTTWMMDGCSPYNTCPSVWGLREKDGKGMKMSPSGNV